MPIPLPEVFQHTHAWSYGCPYVSPSLGVGSIVPPELSDPDVIYVRPPDKYHVFKTPGDMEYIPVPPMPPDPSDPTGMRRMMEFLGFNKDHVDIATTSASNSASVTGQLPGQSVPTSAGVSGGTMSTQSLTSGPTPAAGIGASPNIPGPASAGLIRQF